MCLLDFVVASLCGPSPGEPYRSMHALGAASFLLCVQIGFLYIRYVGSPRTLWDWVQPYVRDSEVRILTSHTMLLPAACPCLRVCFAYRRQTVRVVHRILRRVQRART